jgi:hypothetical protein
MPVGIGSNDSQGIYRYGESDQTSLFSDMLNLGQASTSTQLVADRTRLALLERRGACRLVKTTSQTSNASPGTMNAILFDTEDYDTANLHSTTTNTERITANYAGLWEFTGSLVGNTASDTFGVELWKNGFAVSGTLRWAAGTSVAGYSSPQVTAILSLSSADYVELRFGVNSASKALAVGISNRATFTARYLGPA